MVRIYGIICPISGEIRYIGKTEKDLDRRLRNHLAEARKKLVSHKQRWLRKCLDIGLLPSMWILEEVEAGGCWKERERAWIAKATALGFRLTNQTAGGEGVQLTYPVTIARHRASLSAAMKRVRDRPGYKECRAEIAKSNWQNHRDSMLAGFSSDECKAKQSESKKSSWANPDTRARMMNRWTPEAKATQATALEARRGKIKAAMTPEVRAKQAATLKATWARRKAAK